MTRPIYETQENLSNEDRVAQTIARWSGVEIIKLGPKYSFDRALIQKGEITGFMEIKCRTNPSTQYPDYLISAHKMFHALLWKDLLGMNVFLAVQWTDRLGYHEIDPKNDYPCRLAGRTDRDDTQDLEPCLFIPIAWFKTVTTNPTTQG